VSFLEIEPYENPLALDRFSIVFMITVIEHLPDPLATVQNFSHSGDIILTIYSQAINGAAKSLTSVARRKISGGGSGRRLIVWKAEACTQINLYSVEQTGEE